MPTSLSLGRAGEYLAASILELYGCHVSIASARGCDLWVQTKDGKIHTVEVKAGRVRNDPDLVASRLGFSVSADSQAPVANWLVCVNLDKQLLVLMPHPPRKDKRYQIYIPHAHFTPDVQDASIRLYLDL